MGERWLRGAKRWDTGSTHFAAMGPGHTRKMTWHTTEGNSIYGAAVTLRDRGGIYYHLLADRNGDMMQFCPADRAARSLENGRLFPGGCNMYGKINIQVSLVGYAADDPVRNYPREIIDKIVAWADSWDVPRRIPHGDLGRINRNTDTWLHDSGHFAHGQAPGNSHTDPGHATAIDLFREDDMPKFATFSRGAFTVPPGRAVWLNWLRASGDTDKVWSPRSSVLRLPAAVYSATAELDTSRGGPLSLAFCEVEDKNVREVRHSDIHQVQPGRSLVTNVSKIAGSSSLRVKLTNPTKLPVRVTGVQLRLSWW